MAQSGVSVDDALDRLSGDEASYIAGLRLFLTDPTMHRLDAAVDAEDWMNAYYLSMTVQGVAGNLGFSTLHKLACELERAIKHSRREQIDLTYKMILQNYWEIFDLISKYTSVGND